MLCTQFTLNDIEHEKNSVSGMKHKNNFVGTHQLTYHVSSVTYRVYNVLCYVLYFMYFHVKRISIFAGNRIELN